MRHSRSFENAPQSVTAARHFAIATLQNAAAETLEAIQLMVSELASNCVRHTDSRFDLTIHPDSARGSRRSDRLWTRRTTDALAQTR